ncbi:MAG: ATP-dependent helicase C-terminal domain-containing protein, partial [Micrococcales bacterium]|nr:ATP-dependent helicase C-terminal domain-containing protein [Micrococcales bacterium]
RLGALIPSGTGRARPPRDAAGLVVALAFPERIGRRDGSSYLLASGTRAALPAGSSLTGHDWLAIAEVTRASDRGTAGTGAVIRLAAPLAAQDALEAAAHLRSEEVVARWREGRVTARRVASLGAIELSSTPVAPTAAVARGAVLQALQAGGVQLLNWAAAAASMRRRLAVLHHYLGEPWPDVSDAALLERLPEWFGPELDALARGTRADRIDLLEPLRRLLPWPAAARFGDLVPERLEVPSGSRVRIAYPDVEEPGARPVVAVRLQECFGWAQTPRLLDGRVSVLFHLLSPAGRPLAVTDDLASFWSGPYAQVRAQMRGRYPKHPWPQDPWTAPATSRVTGRRPGVRADT